MANGTIQCSITRHDSRGYAISTTEYDFDGNELHECPRGVCGVWSEVFGDEDKDAMMDKAARLLKQELSAWVDPEECTTNVVFEECEE